MDRMGYPMYSGKGKMEQIWTGRVKYYGVSFFYDYGGVDENLFDSYENWLYYNTACNHPGTSIEATELAGFSGLSAGYVYCAD